MPELKRTPFYEEHVAAGGKIIDFGGWEMPVQYAGVIEEHHMVRRRAGLFDVSHMGEAEVRGKDALPFIQYLVTNDASKIADGQILYTPMCYPTGGIVDDLLVYRYDGEHFLLVINASNTDKDVAWIKEQARDFAVEIKDLSPETAQLALQGPLAQQVLQRITDIDLLQIRYYWFAHGQIDGVSCLISRTGYTGEDGFEIYFSPREASRLWQKILETGKEEGIGPAGLGARDTLRLEARLPLYGHELSETISPWEGGIGPFVKLGKAEDFIGKEALKAQKEAGVPRKLVGLEMIGRGIARAHYPVFKDGTEIGVITSGSVAPSLDKTIALGLIRMDSGAIGDVLDVIIREKPVQARIIPTPFYKRGQ